MLSEVSFGTYVVAGVDCAAILAPEGRATTRWYVGLLVFIIPLKMNDCGCAFRAKYRFASRITGPLVHQGQHNARAGESVRH